MSLCAVLRVKEQGQIHGGSMAADLVACAPVQAHACKGSHFVRGAGQKCIKRSCQQGIKGSVAGCVAVFLFKGTHRSVSGAHQAGFDDALFCKLSCKKADISFFNEPFLLGHAERKPGFLCEGTGDNA